MTDDVIRNGDLVMLVKTLPCGCEQMLGKIFVAGGNYKGACECMGCAKMFLVLDAVWVTGERTVVAKSRLKKINPPPIEESVVTKVGIEA